MSVFHLFESVIMTRGFITFTLSLFWLTGSSLGSKVLQVPSALLESPNVTVIIKCSHNISLYNTILWYQQSIADANLKLIGFVYYKNPTIEDQFKEHFEIRGDGQIEASLQLLSGPENSAVYYCAASGSEAHFGSGTKLTVLESGLLVTPPTVKVLPPSTKECEDRNKKKKKTLVCVATDFYPDHVTVFWRLNGGANITDGVGTDNTALRGNKLYSITSRLRVPAKKWNKASNRFTCTVRFFNGTTDIYVADHINGEEGQGGDGGITTEYYVRSTKTAKLAYSIFIAKSTFYGLVVMALIWKFQRSSDKQM